MSVLKRKLKSDRGASITWALLIFLVCAVIGSAVLVAGTASSGRMSEVADNDQRYYAVTSAARLLIDLIDDETATIVKEETKAGDSPAETKYYIDGNPNPVGEGTTFQSVTEQAAYLLTKGEVVSNDFDLTAAKSELDVTIQETVDADTGEMTLEIKKTTGNGEKSKTYSLILFFNLDKSEIQETKEGTAQTITTTTGSFTWRLRDIQVGGSQRWVETS